MIDDFSFNVTIGPFFLPILTSFLAVFVECTYTHTFLAASALIINYCYGHHDVSVKH